MKKLVTVTVGVGLLRYVRPIERIPMIGKYAPIVELATGSALAYGIMVKKATNPYVKSIAEAMIIDGALKAIDQYIPKVI